MYHVSIYHDWHWEQLIVWHVHITRHSGLHYGLYVSQDTVAYIMAHHKTVAYIMAYHKTHNSLRYGLSQDSGLRYGLSQDSGLHYGMYVSQDTVAYIMAYHKTQWLTLWHVRIQEWILKLKLG